MIQLFNSSLFNHLQFTYLIIFVLNYFIIKLFFLQSSAKPKLEALASALAELSFNFDFTDPPTHPPIPTRESTET